MKVDVRRRITACALLAIMLTMLACSSLHHHTPVAIEDICQECVNHVHHAGHFSSFHGSMHDCVLCLFLTLAYLVGATLQCTFGIAVVAFAVEYKVQCSLAMPHGAIVPRGPPFLLV